MTRLISHLLRFMLITAGFIAAIAAASLFMLTLGWGGLLRGDPSTEELMKVAVGLSLPLMAAFAGYYAFLPALVLSVISEIFAKRSWLFHALGGIAVAISALAIRSDMPLQSGVLMVVLAAGAVGGTTYWLIAGRSAGKHLDELSISKPDETSID
jgi:hypothetical protein